MKQRILNLLISFDQFIFSLITLGASSPDETISAATWRLEQEGKWQGILFRPIIDTILFFDKEHCKTSFESEVKGSQLNSTYNKINNRKE